MANKTKKILAASLSHQIITRTDQIIRRGDAKNTTYKITLKCIKMVDRAKIIIEHTRKVKNC